MAMAEPASADGGPAASGIAVGELREEYHRRGIDSWSDVELARAVADVIRVPRRDPADSFVLHSALELEARLAMLPSVKASERELARLHMLAIAAQYEAFGPPMEELAGEPAALPAHSDPLAWLDDALSAGDLDEIDRATVALVRQRSSSPTVLAGALIDRLAASTAAAAHAPIFFYHYARVSPRGELTPELLRPLARELGRHPDWRISWIDDHTPGAGASAATLEEALLTVPALGVPGNTFIHPLLMQVDGNESLVASLSGATGSFTTGVARTVLRVAARSMLEEPPDHATYGWTHCLTMPQAVLALAPLSEAPDRLLAIAATYVAGFRAGEGTGPLPVNGELAEVDVDVFELATVAATSHDAHVVKYVLACLDAAAVDPEATPLYLAAGQRLLDVWADRGGDPTDPLA